MQGIEGHSTVKIRTAEEGDYDELANVWEASVRKTHHFLSSSDIDTLKRVVRDKLLPNTNIVFVRDDNGNISGFAGTSGDKIEMLFIAPEYIGMGIGKRLFWHAVLELNAYRLDVNESNLDALNFYMRMGCKVTGRSPMDSMGNPYPVLRLEWIRTGG
ncbi:MAG: GNAT family N-acetyltransferase [Synergistaceae bacterium]|jgi:putative acetyltransferase|nr:GNAT family N-acetyltransferase [Synergistaceae bacterium]